jgi:hypothetical protein
MPITAIALSNFWDMACSLSLAPLPSILSLVEQEHGRTIPLADETLFLYYDLMSSGDSINRIDELLKSSSDDHDR